MSPAALPSAPFSVDIALTGRCNLQCRYCFYADEMVARDDLSTERWRAFLAELGRLAVQRVTLTGGEVFTRPDLFELIDEAIANRMRYSLLTNGTLIDKRVIEQFEVGKRRLRLDSIQVSIDGSRAAIHDRSRPHSFERALRGLQLLTAAGLPATVRVTLNRYNVDNLEEIARLLLDEVGLPGFSTNEAFPCGVIDRQSEGITLPPTQRRQAMETLEALVERYNGRISASAGPLALARQIRLIEEQQARGNDSIPGRGTLAACGGVFNKLGVLHDGTVVPCHNLATLRMGSIGVDDLRELWLAHPIMESLRRRRSIPLETLETCRGCAYQGFCTGGCPAGALFLNGELNARNPMDCYRVHLGEDPFYEL